MKKTFLVLGLFFLFIGGSCLPVLAEEPEELDELDLMLESLDIQEDYVYEFPKITPSAHLHLGYRFVDLDGSSQVFEYEYLENSVTFGAEVRAFNYPHRFYLDFDFANKEDYFGDLRYAYGDLFLLRWLNNTYFHNLNNIRLYDYDPLTPSPGIDIRDAGREYGITARENKFHILGSGFFNDMQRASQGRGVDNKTRIYKIGANSHLGLIEIDFAHVEKRFDVDRDPVLEDDYTATGFRPAGTYEHSRISELEGSGNALKVHSSYTGQWVASASFLQNERENNYSGAKSDVLIGAGSLTWNPMTSLLFALRYTHRDLDNENPESVSITNLADSATTLSYSVKPPVSSNTDTLSLTGRYRPQKGITFRAKYDYQKIDRTAAGIWDLPDSTTRNGISLIADTRLHSTIMLNLKYAYKNVADPAYNTEPEHSNAGHIALTWLPHPSVNLLFSYDLDRQERANLNFAGAGDLTGDLTGDVPWYREADLDSARILGTFQISPKLTLTGTYSYLQYKVVQDLVYDNLGGDPQVDNDVPMDQKAHVFTVGAYYNLTDALYLLGEFTYTRSEGGFYPSNDDLLEPVSIASFSEMEQDYLLLHLGGQYKFSDSLSMDLDYRYGRLEDRLDNIFDDIDDGKAHIAILSATKKW
jgi:predicted porin